MLTLCKYTQSNKTVVVANGVHSVAVLSGGLILLIAALIIWWLTVLTEEFGNL